MAQRRKTVVRGNIFPAPRFSPRPNFFPIIRIVPPTNARGYVATRYTAVIILIFKTFALGNQKKKKMSTHKGD